MCPLLFMKIMLWKVESHLTSRFLAGFPLQRRGAYGLADTVGHLLHVITQIGWNLPNFQAMECWRGRDPIDHTVTRAADAVVDDAGDRPGDTAAPALQQLPVLLGQRAQPLLVRGWKRRRMKAVVCWNLKGFPSRNALIPATGLKGRAPILRPLKLLVISPLLYASHGRRAVVDPDAGAVWSSVAPLDELQIQLWSHQTAAGAAGTIPGFYRCPRLLESKTWGNKIEL